MSLPGLIIRLEHKILLIQEHPVEQAQHEPKERQDHPGDPEVPSGDEGHKDQEDQQTDLEFSAHIDFMVKMG